MAMTRAISTVVDVAICLVLVTAAVATLTTAEPTTASATEAADATDAAVVLASTTVTLEYTGMNDRSATARGTVAGLLADAATVNRTQNQSFVHTVQAATRRSLARFDRPTQVLAVTAGDRPELEVGGTPPPGVDVHSRVLTVPTDTTDRGSTAVTIVVRAWTQ